MLAFPICFPFQEKKIFQIPWMHAARHGWDVEKDAPLFRNWAIHTGIGTLFFAGQIFTLFSLLQLHFSLFLVFAFTNTESEPKFTDLWKAKCFFKAYYTLQLN